jgi:hypothetical protein
MRQFQPQERLRVKQLAQRPHSSAANERTVVVQPRFGRHRQRRSAAIADRDQHIAHEPVAAGALDRGCSEAGAECGIVQPREVAEILRLQIAAIGMGLIGRDGGELVPRAYRQAIIATEHAIAQRRRGIRPESALYARY